MPRRSTTKVCNTPGCPQLSDASHCETHRAKPWANTNGNPRSRGANTTTRQRILERDQGICYICGQAGADQVDHRQPVAEGGTDHPSNLAAIHAKPCHQNKTAKEAARGRRRANQ